MHPRTQADTDGEPIARTQPQAGAAHDADAARAPEDRRRPLDAPSVEAILDCAPDAIVVLDEDLRIRKANRAAVRLYGRGIEGLIGTALSDWLPAHDRAPLIAGVARLRQSTDGNSEPPPALRRDIRLQAANGRELRVEGTLSALRIGGELLLVAILRDLSESLQVRQAFADSEARLEAALAAMADGIAIADASGHIVAFNAAYASFHRFADKHACPPDVAGLMELIEAFETNGTIVPPERWLIPRALRGESGAQREFRLRRRDTGETWYASYNYAPVRAADATIVGAVVSARDVTELRLAREQLENYSRDLHALVAQMHAVEETERQRIARELHDELQQKLAAISLDLGSLAEQLDHERPATTLLLHDLETLVQRAIESTRRIVRDLRPQLLDELGLSAALESMAANFEARSSIRTEVEILGAEIADAMLGPLPATALYRVAQEALNNVLKHARAGFVHLMLDATAPHQVELSITDDGVGIDPESRSAQAAYGLQGMSERVRALGGRLVVAPQPEGGTMVQAIVPKKASPDRGR